MRVGIGLPTAISAVPGSLVVEWARRAEEGPFSSLGVVDRIACDSYDPLVALAAAAAVTRRVLLCTMVVIAPLRNTVLLAREAASLDALSGGRLVLGVAVGARQVDYDATGADFRERGARLSGQLAALRAAWEDERIGPRPAQAGGPRLLVGGTGNDVFGRVARYADGYVMGGGPPRLFARMADKARAAWADHGRPGRPLLWAQAYFALGDDAVDAGMRYMRDYYAFTGPYAERIAAGLLTTPQAVRQFVQGYAEAGCDELVLLPAVAHLDQVERLADAVA
ncbi:MAG: LLM class flavin-dependent oxidoreductase [Armatimonadetes bacterium]|nr:LLM class flavin-dependent oxidoreductase [Armatimonadota bacterium]